MNDETKDELMKRTREWLQSCVNAATRSGVPEEADLEAFILAHIDGEPARLAAALERANEGVRYWTDLAQAEARDAAALRARVAELEADQHCPTCGCGAERIRATPLTSTALADELERSWQQTAQMVDRAEKAEADLAAMMEQWKAELNHANAWMRKCQAAEAALAEAHERLDEFGMRRDGTTATPVEGIAAMRTRIDEYRAEWYRAEAQMEAAREAAERIVKTQWRMPDCYITATAILRAMDEAAKK